MIKQISPQLIVTNIERSIAFYTEKLGFDVDFRHEDFYASIIKDGHSIHLKTGKPSVEERKNRRKHEDLDIVITVDSIEEVYKQIGRYVEIVQPLRTMPYGKEFYVADPDGYIIAYVEAV